MSHFWGRIISEIEGGGGSHLLVHSCAFLLVHWPRNDPIISVKIGEILRSIGGKDTCTALRSQDHTGAPAQWSTEARRR